MGPTIVSVGGIALDLIAQLPELPGPGRCVVATAMNTGLGGKAANQAVAAARLGAEVAIVGAVGDDEAGTHVLQSLTAERVHTEFVRNTHGASTARVVLQRDRRGAKQVSVFPGANGSVDESLVDAAEEVLRSAAVVMVQLEIPVSACLRAMKHARGGGAQVILDPSPIRTIPDEMLTLATVIRPNASEASLLTGVKVTGRETARVAATHFLRRGLRLVVIEAGSEGNLFATATDEVFVPLEDVPSLDPTGAGDALVGALAVALSESMSLSATAQFASRVAALTTRSLGAQSSMPRRDEL